MKNPFKNILSLFKFNTKKEPQYDITEYCCICGEAFNKPIQHPRGEKVIHKKCEPSPVSMVVKDIPVNLLIKEFLLIRSNESKLAKVTKEAIINRMNFLIETGVITATKKNAKK